MKVLVIDDYCIAETAEQWNEPIEPRQADWFEAAGIVGVASLVNAIWKIRPVIKGGLLIH